MANWQAQISIDIDDLKKRIKVAESELDKIEKKEHKVKLDIDTKTLENAVIKLDRMLESLGKGSGDFKEFDTVPFDAKVYFSFKKPLRKKKDYIKQNVGSY